MRVIIIFLALKLFAFDYFTIKKANEFFNKKEYLKAAKEYLKINNQKAILNAANSYYKAKNYNKAIKLYKKITDKNLLFDKYYNLGNAFAMIGKYEEAIKMYKKALKIKKDKDAEYNLKLLEKLLKKPPQNQTHKKNKKHNKKLQNKQQNNNNKQKQNKQNTQNNQNNRNKKTQQKQIKTKKTTNIQKPNLKKYGIKENLKPFKKIPKKQKDIRIRFYEKRLNQLNFNTLMIPLD